MSSFHIFITNTLWNILGKIGIQLNLFVISVVVTRYLGNEKLGLYAALLVIPSFIHLISSFGLESVLNKMLPELRVKDPSGRQSRYLLQRVMWTRGLLAVGFSFFLYSLTPLYFDLVHMENLAAYRIPLVFYFLVLTANSLLSILFMALLKYKVISAVEGFCTFLNLIFLVGFVLSDYGIVGVLYAYISATAINILIYLFLARKEFLGNTEKCNLSELPHLARVAYLIGIFGFGVMTQSDILLMNYFQVSFADIGYYHLATGLSGMLIFILNGIGPLAFTLFSESYARNSITELSETWCQIVGFTSFLMSPIFAFAFANTDLIVTLIYGNAFAGAGTIFLAYAVFLSIQTLLGGGIAGSMLMAINQKNFTLQSIIEGSIANVVLNVILIPIYGVMGAVSATGLTMVYMVLRQLHRMSQTIAIGSVYPLVGKNFFLAILCLLPMEILGRLLEGNLFLRGILYLLTLTILWSWIKPLGDEHQNVIRKIHPELAIWMRWFIKTS